MPKNKNGKKITVSVEMPEKKKSKAEEAKDKREDMMEAKTEAEMLKLLTALNKQMKAGKRRGR